MTTGSPDEARSSVPAQGDGNFVGTRWVLIAAALFLALFWPILAVRYHFYMERSRYSHCMLLPAVSALWIYDRSDLLAQVVRRTSARGVVVVALGVLMFVYGRLVHANVIQHAGMLLTLCGAIASLYGGAMLRALAFPVGYLVLMVPLHTVMDDWITLPLQGFATTIAERFFDAMGWIVVRDGNVLQLPRLKLLVEEGCSGIHSLYALIALAVAWVFFVPRPVWLRVTLILASVPIAVVANSMRVSITGVLAYKVDPSYAQGVSHETAGMIVFAIGVALLLACDWSLKPDPPAEPDADGAV